MTPPSFSISSQTSSPHQLSTSMDQAILTLNQVGGKICAHIDGRYVLVCRAYDAEAIEQINTLKGRREGRPLVLAFSDFKSVIHAHLNSPLLPLLNLFTDRLTISIPAPPELPTPAHRGTGMVGVRILTQMPIRAISQALNEPLVISSANPTGQPSARSLADLERYQMNHLDRIEDESLVGLSSTSTLRKVTVVALVDSKLKILAQGGLSLDELESEWARLQFMGLA